MEVGGTKRTAVWDGEMNPRLPLTSVPSAFALSSISSEEGYTSSLTVEQPTGGSQKFVVPDQGAPGTYQLLTRQAANGSFIQNQGERPQIGNLWMQNANGAKSTVVIQGQSAQTASILRVIDASENELLAVGPSGGLRVASGALSDSALRVVNGNSAAVATVIRGAEDQQADMLQLQTSEGGVVFAVTADGRLGVGSVATDAQVSISVQSPSTTGLAIKGAAGQKADLARISDSDDNTLLKVSGTGAVTLRNATDSSAALSIQNAAGGNLFRVDTKNNQIALLENNSAELSPWQETTALPTPLHGQQVVAYGGYAYSVGGNNTADVRLAKLQSNGSIGSWQTTKALPTAVNDAAVTIVNGSIYVVGGTTNGVQQQAVYVAKLQADGTISNWQTGASLPQARSGAAIYALNDRIYLAGGDYDGAAQQAVYVAKVQTNGMLSNWQTTTPLPSAQSDAGFAAANGYIYVVGGSIEGTKVSYAPVLSNGQLGDWATTTSLPQARKDAGVVVAGGRLYVVGGSVQTGATDSVLYAPLLVGGGVGQWQAAANAMPVLRSDPSVFTNNGYIYAVGGASVATSHVTSLQRVQINGTLDLVGGSTGDAGQNNNGGELIAGNTTIVGGLTVQGDATFTKVHVAGDLTVQGLTTLLGGLQIGSQESDDVQANLGLDSYNAFDDDGTCSATTNQGALYYNTASTSIRSCASGSWTDVITLNGLGLLAYGVMPESGSNPGDLASLSAANASGPCKVSWDSPTSVRIAPCTAYSGGRKVTVPATTLSGITAAGHWYHVSISKSGSPILSAAQIDEGAGLPAWSATAPTVVLADVYVGGGGAIQNIYDTRVFTTSTKVYATIDANNAPLGAVVRQGAAGQVALTTADGEGNVRGVIVASSGSSSASAPNAIIVTSGPVFVKTVQSPAAGTVLTSSAATRGYAYAGPLSVVPYSSLGVSQLQVSGVCSASANCQFSQLIDLNIK